MSSSQKLGILYHGDKVQGSAKQGTIVLSENLQIPDSLIGVGINSPQFKEYFASIKTKQKLEGMIGATKNPSIIFIGYLNNAVQNAQLSDEVRRIYLKDLTKGIEQMSSVYEFENTEKFLKLTGKFISHGFHLFRTLNGEETQEEGLSPEEQLEITPEDEANFELFSQVIDQYNEAQQILKDVDPADVLKFMKSRCGRYDSFYTVQEFIRFMLRSLYNLGVDFDMNLNMALNIYGGLPVYNLKQKLRTDLLIWVVNRNWPDDGEDEDFDDALRNVGCTLSRWAKKIIEVIRNGHDHEFDVKQLEEKTRFYQKIIENSYQYLSFLYAPLLLGNNGLPSVDMTFGEVARECYLTTQIYEIRVIDGVNLFVFNEVQLSSMEQQQRASSYKSLRKSLCKKYGIQGREFIVANPRNNRQASYNFEDSITDLQFMGDRLFFYKCEGAKAGLKGENSSMKLLFIKLSENFLLPLLLDANVPLLHHQDPILAGLLSHQFEFSEDNLRTVLRHGNDDINWSFSLNDYYKLGSQGNREIIEDDNSRIGVMFTLSEEAGAPAYKKEENDEAQRFKVQVGEGIKNFFVKSEETADFDPKYVSASILGVNVTHHSLKIDTVSGFNLKASEFSDSEEAKTIEASYKPFAILSKSYSGFELLFRKGGTSGDYFSSNSGNIYTSDNIADRKAAIIFYMKTNNADDEEDEEPIEHGMEDI